MYIGRYGTDNSSFFTNNYSSYATKVGYYGPANKRYYCGITDNKGTVQCGPAGHSNAQARQNFCNKYGPVKCKGFNVCHGQKCPEGTNTPQAGGPNMFGVLNADGTNPAGILEPGIKSLQNKPKSSVTSSPGGGGAPSGGGGGSGTPSSKVCTGCNNWWEIGCELGKLSCEFGKYWENWAHGITGGLGDWGGGLGDGIGKGILPIAILGLAGLLGIVLISKR